MDTHYTRAVCPLLLILASVLLLVGPNTLLAQKKSSTLREFLLQYKGKDVLVMDKTGGIDQFTSGDASKSYTVMLVDVLNDYIVVSRDSDTDKRTFAYPLSIIRRVIFLYDGKPYQKIVLEMY